MDRLTGVCNPQLNHSIMSIQRRTANALSIKSKTDDLHSLGQIVHPRCPAVSRLNRPFADEQHPADLISAGLSSVDLDLDHQFVKTSIIVPVYAIVGENPTQFHGVGLNRTLVG